MDWLTGTVRRWVALVGAVLTLSGAIGYAVSDRRLWAWLAILALVLLAVALAWNARDAQRALAAADPDPRMQLRRRLKAAAERLEHLGSTDANKNPQWFLDQFTERHNATFKLIDASLGPKLADEFSGIRGVGMGMGISQIQSDMAARAAYVRDLLDRLDWLPIMGDWQP